MEWGTILRRLRKRRNVRWWVIWRCYYARGKVSWRERRKKRFAAALRVVESVCSPCGVPLAGCKIGERECRRPLRGSPWGPGVVPEGSGWERV